MLMLMASHGERSLHVIRFHPHEQSRQVAVTFRKVGSEAISRPRLAFSWQGQIVIAQCCSMLRPSDDTKRHKAEAQSTDYTRKLPQHVLSAILQLVPKVQQPDVRSGLALVCQTWRECANVLPDVVLTLAVSERSVLLTDDQEIKLKRFLRSTRTLAIYGLAERQRKLAVQIAACGSKLSSLKLRFMEPLQFKWDAYAGLQRCTDFALLLLQTNLLTLDIRTQTRGVLVTQPPQNSAQAKFANIILGNLDLLRGLANLADGLHDWQQPALDMAVLRQMPSLQVLYAWRTGLHSLGFKGLLLGRLCQETQQSFREAAEVHCFGDSEITPAQQLFLEACEPFPAMIRWLCPLTQCPSTICRLAPNL